MARWIEPVETERSAHTLRQTFAVNDRPRKARLYATAHGIYECFLNGHRVGNFELTPGFTTYSTCLHVQAYDVTELLRKDDNVWEVVLSDGWYRGRTGFRQRLDGFGTTLGFLGQLEMDDVIVSTGATWRSLSGPLVSADLIAGQVEDHRRIGAEVGPVIVPTCPLGPLAWSPSPPVRRVQALRPLSVTRQNADRQIVDPGAEHQRMVATDRSRTSRYRADDRSRRGPGQFW